MSAPVRASTKKATARKPAAARKETVSARHRPATEPKESKVLIKPLYGKEAFELMQELGILDASGKATPAYR